jgi:hypothetical protein
MQRKNSQQDKSAAETLPFCPGGSQETAKNSQQFGCSLLLIAKGL